MLVANNPPCNSDTLYFDVTVAQSNSSVHTFGLENLRVSPNPSADIFTIKFNGFEHEIGFNIYSLEGSLLFTKQSYNLDGNTGASLLLQDMPEGIYLLKINSSRGENTRKIQILK